MEFGSRQTQKAKEACEQIEQEKNGLVPSIAVWEIAIKIKNRKLDLGVGMDDYSNPISFVESILSPKRRQPKMGEGSSFINPARIAIGMELHSIEQLTFSYFKRKTTTNQQQRSLLLWTKKP